MDSACGRFAVSAQLARCGGIGRLTGTSAGLRTEFGSIPKLTARASNHDPIQIGWSIALVCIPIWPCALAIQLSDMLSGAELKHMSYFKVSASNLACFFYPHLSCKMPSPELLLGDSSNLGSTYYTSSTQLQADLTGVHRT